MTYIPSFEEDKYQKQQDNLIACLCEKSMVLRSANLALWCRDGGATDECRFSENKKCAKKNDLKLFWPHHNVFKDTSFLLGLLQAF